MEIIESFLSDIIPIIKDNFWQFLIIIALLKSNRYYQVGLLLLFSHLFIGYHWYMYVLALAIILLSSITFSSTNNISNKEKEDYETRIKELETKLKDDEIRIENMERKLKENEPKLY